MWIRIHNTGFDEWFGASVLLTGETCKNGRQVLLVIGSSRRQGDFKIQIEPEEIVNEYDTGSVPALVYLSPYIQCCGSGSFWEAESASRSEGGSGSTLKLTFRRQCCGSVTFWYRSGSADSDLWPTDSTPDPYLGRTIRSGSGRPKNIRIRNTRSYDGSK